MRSKMKKLVILLVLVLLAYNVSESRTPYFQSRVTFHTFYYSLAPYGEWIEIDYGLYAWRPARVYVGWAPYLIGRWVWTPYGWYWDSFEPFGWAVYHYGRWYYDDYYGWIWIPDYEWAPAWVEWRYTDYYIGWAPLPPYASFSISIGIRFSINWYSPHHYWHFVPVKYFSGYEVHRYVVAPKYKYRIYRDSKYSVNYKYDGGRVINYGVDRNFVERKGGRIFEARVEETSRLRDFTEGKTNDRNRVLIYRPDEREINRDIDFKVRKTDRRISLDVDRIQTPRERIDIKEIERNTNRIEQNRRERDENLDRNRNMNQNNENIDERTRNRNFETNRDLKPDNRTNPDMKLFSPREHKSDRDFDNRARENFENQNFERKRNDIRIENRRERETPRFENERKDTRTNPQRDEIRKTDTDNLRSRETNRQRER